MTDPDEPTDDDIRDACKKDSDSKSWGNNTIERADQSDLPCIVWHCCNKWNFGEKCISSAIRLGYIIRCAICCKNFCTLVVRFCFE